MAAGWTRRAVELATGSIEQKKRYRQYKARAEWLPANYRAAIEAIERYTYYFGPGTGAGIVQLLEDLIDLFEQGAANGTPIRAIVGEDPVEFAEEFLRNYPEGHWITRERERLTSAIDRAAGDVPGDVPGNEGASR